MRIYMIYLKNIQITVAEHSIRSALIEHITCRFHSLSGVYRLIIIDYWDLLEVVYTAKRFYSEIDASRFLTSKNTSLLLLSQRIFKVACSMLSQKVNTTCFI